MIFGIRKLESWGYHAALFAWSYVTDTHTDTQTDTRRRQIPRLA